MGLLPDIDDTRANRPMTPGEKWFVFGFSALVFGGFGVELLLTAAPGAAMVPVFLAGWIALTALHEMGHSLVAWACGWKVSRIVVGFGGVWKAWTWRGTRYELHKVPLGGHMVPSPRAAGYWRLKSALIYLAGPGTELGVAALLALAVGWDPVFEPSTVPSVMVVQAIGAAAIWGAFTNLIPLTTSQGGVTDGLGAILAPFRDPKDFMDMFYVPTLIECEALMAEEEYEQVLERIEPIADANPDAISIQMLCAEAMVRVGRRTEALMQLQALKSRRRAQANRIDAVLKRLRELPQR